MLIWLESIDGPCQGEEPTARRFSTDRLEQRGPGFDSLRAGENLCKICGEAATAGGGVRAISAVLIGSNQGWQSQQGGPGPWARLARPWAQQEVKATGSPRPYWPARAKWPLVPRCQAPGLRKAQGTNSRGLPSMLIQQQSPLRTSSGDSFRPSSLKRSLRAVSSKPGDQPVAAGALCCGESPRAQPCTTGFKHRKRLACRLPRPDANLSLQRTSNLDSRQAIQPATDPADPVHR